MQETYYTIPGCPLKIALVSDLHERPFASVVRSLYRNRPELICIAGDFVYGACSENLLKPEKAVHVLPFLARCAGIAPSFVSLGNHEWLLTPADLEQVEKTGVRLLDNSYTVSESEKGRLVIGGLTSANVSSLRRPCTDGGDLFDLTSRAAHLPRHTPPELDWLSAFCAEPGFHILLSHHPEYYPRHLRQLPIELIVSGHAHGGQIRLLGQGLYAPGQGLLPRLTAGVHEGRLVVSRGLANTVRVPRLFNPPELVYLLPGET